MLTHAGIVPNDLQFHSAPESALKSQITKLAKVETIAVVSSYLGAGLPLGTFRYL